MTGFRRRGGSGRFHRLRREPSTHPGQPARLAGSLTVAAGPPSRPAGSFAAGVASPARLGDSLAVGARPPSRSVGTHMVVAAPPEWSVGSAVVGADPAFGPRSSAPGLRSSAPDRRRGHRAFRRQRSLRGWFADGGRSWRRREAVSGVFLDFAAAGRPWPPYLCPVAGGPSATVSSPPAILGCTPALAECRFLFRRRSCLVGAILVPAAEAALSPEDEEV
jgi:hypothetical protein